MMMKLEKWLFKIILRNWPVMLDEISDILSNKWYLIRLTLIFHFLHNSIYKYVLSLSFYVCYETMENKFPNKEELKEDTEVDEAWKVII